MQTSWIHTKTISDGEKYEINGLNIWDYNWDKTGETVVVKDPLYEQSYSMNVYVIQQTMVELLKYNPVCFSRLSMFYLQTANIYIDRRNNKQYILFDIG